MQLDVLIFRLIDLNMHVLFGHVGRYINIFHYMLAYHMPQTSRMPNTWYGHVVVMIFSYNVLFFYHTWPRVFVKTSIIKCTHTHIYIVSN